MRRPSLRSLAGGAAGIVAGVAGGIALTSISAAGVPQASTPGLIEAAHLPPVLTIPGEAIRLRYALVCSPHEDGRPCEGSGVVHVHAGQGGPFQTLALRRGEESKEGRYFVDLPDEVASARDGFSYYAVLRDDFAGSSVTVPSGGAAAPQRSFPLVRAVELDLGAHAFGRLRCGTPESSTPAGGAPSERPGSPARVSSASPGRRHSTLDRAQLSRCSIR